MNYLTNEGKRAIFWRSHLTLSTNSAKMTPEQQREINEHVQAIAKILYQEADPTKLASLAGIEETIRQQTLEHITPQLGFFFVKETTGTEAGRQRTIKSIIGELLLTEKPAIRLELANSSKN